MKVNVYRSQRGAFYFSEPGSLDDEYLADREHYHLLSPIDLPIEPALREVEKVIMISNGRYIADAFGEHKHIEANTPIDAYDITVHYKVKEPV